ncbi:MAG: PH domain-containing protein, partial [Acidimicrobiia bacterium]|nr:PH domain-containing protein [Acidimicrobiia bacterium]
MFELVERLLKRFLRLPPPPTEPEGSEGSTHIFHASSNYYRLRKIRWVLSQIGAAMGLAAAFGWFWIPNAGPFLEHVQFGPFSAQEIITGRLFHSLEIWGLLTYLVQLPITAAMVRLDYTQRWYLVTDRSLRIREGLRTVREQTMTFANIQNMAIRQNPIQRVLGLSDLHVRSAGGGDKDSDSGGDGDEKKALHLAIFRGVDNAEAIRDLILDRLKLLKSSGVGDPEEGTPEAPMPEALLGGKPGSPDIAAAVRKLRQEA